MALCVDLQYAAGTTIFVVNYGYTILWFNMASPYCGLIWLYHIVELFGFVIISVCCTVFVCANLNLYV